MKDNILAVGRWDFNSDVANCFEDMLTRSIPSYNIMRDLVLEVSSKFIKEGGYLLDVGCSNGLNLLSFARKYPNVNLIGLDNSVDMIEKSNILCKDYPLINTCTYDVSQGIPYTDGKFNVITSVLTLQFIPLEKRPKVISDIYSKLKHGGAFIIVEKVISSHHLLDELFTDLYIKHKLNNNYTQEQIDLKRKSLEGVLVPLTTEWNKDLILKAGFGTCEVFWKHLNFEGMVAIKC